MPKSGIPIRVSRFLPRLRDSNYVRTCRWHVHEPVRTLVNTLISFRVPRKRKEMQANPNQRASRQRRDKRLDHSAVKVIAENCRFAGTSSTASGSPVHLAVPENCCGLALFLAVFDRCGNPGFASSATGSTKPEFPVRGEGFSESQPACVPPTAGQARWTATRRD